MPRSTLLVAFEWPSAFAAQLVASTRSRHLTHAFPTCTFGGKQAETATRATEWRLQRMGVLGDYV
jgi:hypothetical protein